MRERKLETFYEKRDASIKGLCKALSVIQFPVAIQKVFYLLQRPAFVHCSPETFIIVIPVIVEVGKNTSVGVH